MRLKRRKGAAQQRDRPLVLFAMEYVPAYRAPFYPSLKQRLDELGIDLALSYGNPPPSRRARHDAASIDFGEFRSNRCFTVMGREFTFQPIPRQLRDADLVIVQQEAGLALNYLLAVRSLRRGSFAFWGHGEDPNEATRSTKIEAVKGHLVRRSAWAFAYTSRSKSVFARLGMSPDRITVTNNALPPSIQSGKAAAGIRRFADNLASRTSNVGWLSTSLDAGKRLDFLFDVLDQVRSRVEDFEFVLIGDGASRDQAEQFANDRSWFHYVGTLHGADKEAIGATSSIMIMPGAVGLHVLDSFAFGSPLVASDEPSNSHELSYIRHGENGIVLDRGASPADYSTAIVDLIQTDGALEAMISNALADRELFTMENMVERFATGIARAIDQNAPAARQ